MSMTSKDDQSLAKASEDGRLASGRRGRPQEFVPPKKLSHLPLDQLLKELSPTARSLLEAGRRILDKKGLRGLTLEAAAFEAGASKSTLVEQFGNRATYLAMLLDSLWQDETVDLVQHFDAESGVSEQETPSIESLEAAIGSLGGLYEDAGADRVYYEIVALALHDQGLRRRLEDLFRWYRQLRLNILSQSVAAESCTPRQLELLAGLIEAAEDGHSLRRAIDPDYCGFQAEMDLLAHMVALFVREEASESP